MCDLYDIQTRTATQIYNLGVRDLFTITVMRVTKSSSWVTILTFNQGLNV